ncbi:type I restriction endonuclease subunit R [Microbacterium esteraromaticum]|nr:type I restriction endonuclease subunit R [Microbacterium esteraromaticum]
MLLSTIRGLFNKERLVKILESFICFHDSEPSKKVICRYPQFFGAIKLLKNIEVHSKGNPEGDGKGGIYFGAAGCGKSYTMLFLTKLLQKSKHLNNPTVLLITDRRSLDRQLYNTFKCHKEFLSSGELARMEGGMQL